jgi:23S rRNA pseudouridine1911/1915/1917 synthase
LDHVEFIVSADHATQRLDRFLAVQLPEMSRTRVQSLVDEGRVQVDGTTVKPSYRVEEGDVISVEVPPPPDAAVEAEPISLEVLYEDEDVAVINKSAGMIIHPGAGAETGTMVAALLHRFGGMAGLSNVGGPLRPGIVHRLDKGTSGAVVIAKTDAAHKRLVEEFRDRTVKKTYIALLHGRLKGDAGTIDLPVARDLRRRSRMTARRREGRQARTDWKMRFRLGAFTFIEADLHTGRTHQIRVHFSALGCPVVGDTLYGAPRQERVQGKLLPTLDRNFLHAARLAFGHPTTGKQLEARAPIPDELVSYLRLLSDSVGENSSIIEATLKDFS